MLSSGLRRVCGLRFFVCVGFGFLLLVGVNFSFVKPWSIRMVFLSRVELHVDVDVEF